MCEMCVHMMCISCGTSTAAALVSNSVVVHACAVCGDHVPFMLPIFRAVLE